MAPMFTFPCSRIHSTDMARLRAFLVGRFTVALSLALAAMAFFVFIAHAVGEGETRRVDRAVVQYFAAHQSAGLHTAMQALSLLANGGALTVIAVLCALGCVRRPRFRPDGLSLLVAIGGGELLLIGLKTLFHRPRPSAVFASLGYSFPSGHSFFAVTLYGMMAYWLIRETPARRWVWAPTVALILLIGFSRIYLGVHYASDVLAGFCVGLPWLWACLALPTAFGLAQRKDPTP